MTTPVADLFGVRKLSAKPSGIAVVDRVRVDHLLVASGQLARPIRAILRVGLGTRLGRNERGGAERHHAGNPGEEAATRRHECLLEIGHRVLPLTGVSKRLPVSPEKLAVAQQRACTFDASLRGLVTLSLDICRCI